MNKIKLGTVILNSFFDKIRTVIAGDLKFVYVIKVSLYLVAVSRTTETASELALQLQYVYEMIIFILTEKIQVNQ